jgi:hypothetical protein
MDTELARWKHFTLVVLLMLSAFALPALATYLRGHW